MRKGVIIIMSLPICTIAVFDSKIKGTVRFTETP